MKAKPRAYRLSTRRYRRDDHLHATYVVITQIKRLHHHHIKNGPYASTHSPRRNANTFPCLRRPVLFPNFHAYLTRREPLKPVSSRSTMEAGRQAMHGVETYEKKASRTYHSLREFLSCLQNSTLPRKAREKKVKARASPARSERSVER